MAVDVGSAKGYLDLDISGFLSGLKTAQSEADKSSKNIVSKIGGAMDTVGQKMMSIGGFATAGITTPIVTAVTASVKQFANLEQSIGGVETLFKSSANTVIENAEKAYKTAGVDANTYMEQVTSFSASLLQGLGGDTVKAAEYADMAITDMSDNANKFGTDIGLIQNAYQGFAKDNYSMLDNLKLGYGGTASEMARLVNESGVLNGTFEATAENVKDIPFDVLIEAIHKTQENLGIMGATAAEAEGTVSGSFVMMKASVLNFLQQLGNPGADMDAFAKAMLDSVGVFVGNVKRVLSTIWDNLPISDLEKKLLVAAAAFGPVMLAGGKVVSTVGSITTGVSNAIPVIKNFTAGFGAAGQALGASAPLATQVGAALAGITGPMLAIVAAIALVIAAFTSLWKNNEEFRNNVIAIWNQVKETFNNFTQGIVDRLNSLGFDFKNITEVIKAVWEGFCNFLAPIFEGIFQHIANTFQVVTDVILGIMDVFISIFKGDWKGAWNAVKGIFETIWNGIKDWFKNILNVIKGIVEVVLSWFDTTWKQTWNSIKTFFVNIWNSIKTWFQTTLNNIKTTFTNIWNSIKTWFQTTLNNIKTTFVNTWNNIKSTFNTVLNNIKTAVTNAFNSVKSTISNAINNVKSTISNGLNAAKSTVSSIFDSIKSKISSVMETAKNTVKNGIDKLKSFFNFTWSLPKIKLPHFSISGSFSLNPPSIPHFSVSWYKKAMSGGMILNSPTIFGFDPTTGKFLGGGEAGSETVVGTANLMKMIRQAVADVIKPIVDITYQLAKTSVDLGYVTHSGFAKQMQTFEKIAKSENGFGGGDTFNFYSPKSIDEIEAAKQMKKAKRELAEGF